MRLAPGQAPHAGDFDGVTVVTKNQATLAPRPDFRRVGASYLVGVRAGLISRIIR